LRHAVDLAGQLRGGRASGLEQAPNVPASWPPSVIETVLGQQVFHEEGIHLASLLAQIPAFAGMTPLTEQHCRVGGYFLLSKGSSASTSSLVA